MQLIRFCQAHQELHLLLFVMWQDMFLYPFGMAQRRGSLHALFY